MLIEVENVTKEYSNEVITKALNGVSFKIRRGEFVAIMGPSGSGKSTLLHILGLLDRPTSGIYRFEGKLTNNLSDDEASRLRNKKMGFVFQNYNLLPRITVLENVKLPLMYSGIKDKYATQKAFNALDAVGLKNKAFHYPNQLSGGEQQRVAIARALVNNPSIIFADEPTGNLDSKSGERILKIFQDLNQKGHTIILVTHETLTAQIAERIIKLKDGKIISDEPVTNRKKVNEFWK